MSLRDIDWRLLLPETSGTGCERLVLRGGTSATAEALVAAGVARSVEPTLGAPESADRVVVLAGESFDAAVIARSLRRGGFAYIEVDRSRGPFRSAPHRLHRWLRGHGLAVHGTYGVLPDFRRARVRFPLEWGHALEWYLRTLFVADTAARRAALWGLRAMARAPQRVRASILPRYAIVIGKGPYAAPSILGRSDLPAGLRTGVLRPLVLTRGERDGTRVALFPFAAGERVPRAVLKLSRLAGRNEHTHHEQRVLARLRAELPAELGRSIPVPLGIVPWSGLAVGIESCVPGRVLSATSSHGAGSRRRALDDLELAVAWLTRLQTSAQAGQMRPSLEGLERYARVFGLTPGEERLFAAARRCEEELDAAWLPRVWQHWGYGEWNIYRDGSAVAVIDWEGGDLGLPVYDMVHLVTTWYVTAHGRGLTVPDATFRIFVQKRAGGRLAEAARAQVARYFDSMQIHGRYLPLLLTTYWISRSLGHSGRGSERSGNPHVPNVTVLADAVDALFA